MRHCDVNVEGHRVTRAADRIVTLFRRTLLRRRRGTLILGRTSAYLRCCRRRAASPNRFVRACAAGRVARICSARAVIRFTCTDRRTKAREGDGRDQCRGNRRFCRKPNHCNTVLTQKSLFHYSGPDPPKSSRFAVAIWQPPAATYQCRNAQSRGYERQARSSRRAVSLWEMLRS